MGDTDRLEVDESIAGDWLLITSALVGWLDWGRLRNPARPSWVGGPEPPGYKMTIFDGVGIARVIADVWLSGDATTTRIRIISTHQHAALWTDALAFLNIFASGHDMITRTMEPTPDQVIEYYYRSRAAGRRVTLRQIAKERGISYSTLTKHKMAYDAGGGWGSRKKEKTKIGE